MIAGYGSNPNKDVFLLCRSLYAIFSLLLIFIKILIHDTVALKLDYQLVLQQRYIYTQAVENQQLKVYNHGKARNTLLLEAGRKLRGL